MFQRAGSTGVADDLCIDGSLGTATAADASVCQNVPVVMAAIPLQQQKQQSACRCFPGKLPDVERSHATGCGTGPIRLQRKDACGCVGGYVLLPRQDLACGSNSYSAGLCSISQLKTPGLCERVQMNRSAELDSALSTAARTQPSADAHQAQTIFLT